jgi:hypothetical protein
VKICSQDRAQTPWRESSRDTADEDSGQVGRISLLNHLRGTHLFLSQPQRLPGFRKYYIFNSQNLVKNLETHKENKNHL